MSDLIRCRGICKTYPSGGGRIRVRIRDSEGEVPLPARIRLLPLDGTKPLELGPDWRAAGASSTRVRNRRSELRETARKQIAAVSKCSQLGQHFE